MLFRSKASILQHSAFFIVQLSIPYMTTGKTIAVTRQIFVGKVMSLPFNILSMLVITFLPRSKWLHSPSAVILESSKVSLSLFPLCSLNFDLHRQCAPVVGLLGHRIVLFLVS